MMKNSPSKRQNPIFFLNSIQMLKHILFLINAKYMYISIYSE